MADTRPAHETKEIATLAHPFIDHVFNLNQVTDGKCNGTALWLGGQVLALYLAHILPRSKEPQRKRVVELGSGVGLTSYVLCKSGSSDFNSGSLQLGTLFARL
jgi:predicted nicotinamide N-methyase